MFVEGTIIYFDPFYFKNGNPAKPKYFIVLKNDTNQNIIAALPTRKDVIPANEVVEYGCIELPNINFNCFAIPPNKMITECGKKFDFPTFLYGHLIDDYLINQLKEIYPNEESDYTIWGKMKIDIFKELINCFKNSTVVKRKYKKLL